MSTTKQLIQELSEVEDGNEKARSIFSTIFGGATEDDKREFEQDLNDQSNKKARAIVGKFLAQ